MDQKGRLLVVKLSPLHMVAVKQMAEADRESVAVLVRRLIRSEAQQRGLWPVAHTSPKEVRDV